MPPKKQLKVEGGEVVIAQKPSAKQSPQPEIPAHDYLADYQAVYGSGVQQVQQDVPPAYTNYSNLPDSDDEGCTVRICGPTSQQSSSANRGRSRSRDRTTSSTVVRAEAVPVLTTATSELKTPKPAFAPMQIAKVRKGMVNPPELKPAGAKLSPSMLKLLGGKDPAAGPVKSSSKAATGMSGVFEDVSKAANDEAYQAAGRTYMTDKQSSASRAEKLHTGLSQKNTHLTGAAEMRQKMQETPSFALDGVSAAALASGVPAPAPLKAGYGMMTTQSGNAMHCRDFKMRRCNRGASCRFLHDGQVPSGTMLGTFAGPPPAHMAVDFDPRVHANLGDWCCPGCMRAQFQRNSHCRKCGFQKPDEPTHIPASLRNLPMSSLLQAGAPGMVPAATPTRTPGGTPHVQL